MTRTSRNTVICLFSALLLAPTVHADSTLTMKDGEGKMDSIIEVKGHMVRMSSPGELDYLLYDAKRDTVIHVSNTNQQYMEIDRAGIAGMADSMSRLKREMAPKMAMMREQLKNMPPDQRAMIEQRLGGMAELGAMETEAVTELTTVKRGEDEVANFECERYDVLSNKQRVTELCIATRTDAGMSKADFETVASAMKFMRDMAGSASKMAAGLDIPQMSMGDVEGVPVSAKDLDSGREFRLVDVSHDALDNARFDAYRVLSKQEMPKIR